MRISDWSSDVCSSDLHEQQHQELLLTDIKHLFAQNPLGPAVWDAPIASEVRQFSAMKWVKGAEGIVSIGHGGDGFAFDCEGPRHDVLLTPHALANRPVSNGEWPESTAEGDHHNPALWAHTRCRWVRARKRGQ